MSTVLMAQPGLHRAMYIVRRAVAKRGARRKRKKNTMVGGACATAPTSFSPFSLVDCMLLSHFSFNDFVTVAFPDLAGDLDTQI